MWCYVVRLVVFGKMTIVNKCESRRDVEPKFCELHLESKNVQGEGGTDADAWTSSSGISSASPRRRLIRMMARDQ